jgi:hypothetical protein
MKSMLEAKPTDILLITDPAASSAKLSAKAAEVLINRSEANATRELIGTANVNHQRVIFWIVSLSVKTRAIDSRFSSNASERRLEFEAFRYTSQNIKTIRRACAE